MFCESFSNVRYNSEKLKAIGFEECESELVNTYQLADGSLVMTVRIKGECRAYCDVRDKETGEEYILHKVAGAFGEFVGAVRSDYEKVLERIAADGFDEQIFNNSLTESLIAYVERAYGTRLEFPWGSDSDAAVCRRQDNKKWYALIMKVKKDRFGLQGDEIVEVVNLKIEPSKKESIVDCNGIFPAYHMNKRSWVSVFLDGSVTFERITALIDESYCLSGKNK